MGFLQTTNYSNVLNVGIVFKSNQAMELKFLRTEAKAVFYDIDRTGKQYWIVKFRKWYQFKWTALFEGYKPMLFDSEEAAKVAAYNIEHYIP